MDKRSLEEQDKPTGSNQAEYKKFIEDSQSHTSMNF